MALLSYALTTVARQKVFLGISTPDFDTVLETLINSATDFIEEYCDRRFKYTVYTNQLYDGTGYDKLMLKQYPVDTGETFTLQLRGSINNVSDWSTIDSEEFFVKDTQGIIDYINKRFIEHPQHYRVTYTAGYDYDNAATFLSDVGAADLEFACWKLVTRYYNQRKNSGDIEQESIGDYSVRFRRDISEDPVVERILNKYLRHSLM